MPEALETRPQAIVFFDGVCGLCNKTVDFLLRVDRRHTLRFAPLQGTSATTLLPTGLKSDMNTIILLDGNRLYTKSTAIIRILAIVGWPWKMALVFYVIPRMIRDVFYDLTASNRYKIFGIKDSCRLPSPEERSRFLD